MPFRLLKYRCSFNIKKTRGREAIRLLAILLLLMGVGACHRIQPIYNVQDHPIPSASLGLSTAQVTQLIAGVAQSKNWLVDPISSTEVRATQKWRDHTAVIFISNDGKSFCIRNEGSTNLLEQGDMIHREYNKRVHALEDAIEKRLYQRP